MARFMQGGTHPLDSKGLVWYLQVGMTHRAVPRQGDVLGKAYHPVVTLSIAIIGACRDSEAPVGQAARMLVCRIYPTLVY